MTILLNERPKIKWRIYYVVMVRRISMRDRSRDSKNVRVSLYYL